jgi:hypothetical protein
MSKKLNTASITNELAESAFFRPATQPVKQEEKLPVPLPEEPIIQEAQANPAIPDRPTARPGDEPTYRPVDRSTSKGLLVRRGFEWREDQLRALKKLSLKEQMDGKIGSMSQMVRDALDDYLKKRAAEE